MRECQTASGSFCFPRPFTNSPTHPLTHSPLMPFRLTRPSEQQIAAFLATQRDLTFSYGEVGCTRDAPPAGFVLDHNRALLGAGGDTFDRAVAALHAWRQSSLGWTSVPPPGAPTTPGTDVAVAVRHFGF